MRQASLLLRAFRRRARFSTAQPQASVAQPLHSWHQYQQSQVARRQLHTSACVRRSVVTSAAATVDDAPQDTTSSSNVHALVRLEQCIAQREPAQALQVFQQLSEPPSTLTLQKLAILLAKQKNAAHATRAYDILQSVYRLSGLVPDDYTKLASIYVVDACLRYKLLDQAVETYEEAFNQGVFLDLPAYDALLEALVRADRTLEAVAILNEIADEDDISPTERSYFPLLMALVGQSEYESASDLLEKGQGRGVTFTGETFHPLVERVEKVEEPTDALVMLLTYIEDIWEDAKLFDELADLDDEDLDDDEDDEDHDREGSNSNSNAPRG